jgi:hypothetical protein
VSSDVFRLSYADLRRRFAERCQSEAVRLAALGEPACRMVESCRLHRFGLIYLIDLLKIRHAEGFFDGRNLHEM